MKDVDNKTRELVEKAVKVHDILVSKYNQGGVSAGPRWLLRPINILEQALSPLPPPCEKIFNCKHFRGYSQSVPTPFGSGSCQEPLGDCAIESESEDCCLKCPDYKEAEKPCETCGGAKVVGRRNATPNASDSLGGMELKPCSCQVPAGEVEEFVKDAKNILNQPIITEECAGGDAVRRIPRDYSGWLLSACTHLTALLKQIEEQKEEKKSLLSGHFCPWPQGGKLAITCNCVHSDKHREMDWAHIDKLEAKIKELRKEIGEIRNQWHIDLNDKVAFQAKIEELEAEKKGLERDYNCVESLCNSMDEFGEPMKDNQWTDLGERIYEIVTELKTKIAQLEGEKKRLREAIEWAVERMDEEPAKEVLKQALKGE